MVWKKPEDADGAADLGEPVYISEDDGAPATFTRHFMEGTVPGDITYESLPWTGICRETAARLCEFYSLEWDEIVPYLTANEPYKGYRMFLHQPLPKPFTTDQGKFNKAP